MITRIIGLPTDGDIDLNPETLNGTLSAAYQNHLGSPSRRRVKGRGYSSESLGVCESRLVWHRSECRWGVEA